MIKQIKKKYIEFKTNKIRNSWINDDRKNVLIHLNQYFNKDFWQRILYENSFNEKKFQLIFSNNKYKTIKHFTKADIAFLFGLSSYLDFSVNPVKKLYLPIIGEDYFKKTDLPEETKIFHPKGITSPVIAEYVLSMILSSRNNYDIAIRRMNTKRWDQTLLLTDYNELSLRKNALILGFGNNGKAIAEKLINSGFKVWVSDMQEPEKNYFGECFITLANIENELEKIDYLILAVPFNESTKGIVNGSFLDKLRIDATLINVARGGIVNEEDLIKHLTKSPFFKAVLDVQNQEPLPKNSLLWRLSNIIITPHISGNINRMKNEIAKDFINKCLVD